MLLEDAGAHIDGQGMLMTPKQKLFEEMGVVPKFATGKQVKPLSPEDMRAEISVSKTIKPQSADPYSHPKLTQAWNSFFK